jgi:hypothetical protein
VFGCYPEIIPCRSIAEATALFGDLDQWNIYKKCANGIGKILLKTHTGKCIYDYYSSFCKTISKWQA